MSGRLTILPKKTYCPWKPENIERVLRDERLERERIEKESADVAKHKQQQQRLQRQDGTKRDGNRKDGDDTIEEESSSKEKGHINLFPEAKEAELQLTHGTQQQQQQQQHTNNGKVDESGVAPIPLGGNESLNRKVGNVPFYMRSTTTTATTSTNGSINNNINGNSNNNGEEKYINTNNSFRLGTKRSTNNNYPNNNNTDAITNKLMQDQYIQREDYRKRNMDPMARFYVDANPSSRGRGSVGGIGSMESVYANGITGRSGLVDNIRDRGDTSSKPKDTNDIKIQGLDEGIKDKKHRKKKRKKRSYSSSDSSSTPPSSVDRDRHKKKRKHKSKKKKRSSSHRRDHYHHKSNRDTNNLELQELRRRRHARESNERDRLTNSRGDASSSFDGSTIQTKDGRCYDGSNGFH